MNKRGIISLTLTGISLAIVLIILFQVMPYMNLRNCQVSQEIGLTGFKVIVINNGDQMAKFPRMKFNLYKGDVFVGNGTIEEFEIPAHSNVTKPIAFDLHANLTDIPEIISANETTIDGYVYIKILWGIEIPIKYKVVSNDAGTRVNVLGREIVVD